MTRRSSVIIDPSSRDSIEPVRSQVSKHPHGMGSVILRGTTTVHFANGPALVSLEINSAFGILTGSSGDK